MAESSCLQSGSSATAAAGKETEVADANEATRQHMQQEATQELIDRQSQESLLVFVSGVAPAEGHLVFSEGNETVVGNRNAMSVGAEVTKHLLGSTERRFAVDHPARRVKLTDQTLGTAWAEPGREAGRGTGAVRKREPAGALRETCRGRLR